MPDADDYADAPTPDPAAVDRPEDLRLADRVQLTGWLGVFIGMAIGTVAFVYGVTGTGDVIEWVVGLAASAAVFVAAGGYLVVVGFLERPPRGEFLLMANLVIVVPTVCVMTLTFLSPLATAVLLFVNPQAITCSVLAPAPLLAINYGLLATAAVKHRRRLLPGLRAWLDPTAPRTPGRGRA